MTFDKFTFEQQKIITLNIGNHIVLAPPGTGKTEILSQRILYALENNVNPNEMLCLTFTNRAAKNMKERVERYYKNTDLFIGNIHSFCAKFLKQNKVISENISILDEKDTADIIEELKKFAKEKLEKELEKYQEKIKKLHINWLMLNIKEIENKILKELFLFFKLQEFNFYELSYSIIEQLINKKTLIDERRSLDLLEEIIEFQDKNNKEIKTKFYSDLIQLIFEQYKKYERIKEESNYLDFDDLLILTYKFFIDNPNYQPKYTWIQIDEVQDLNLFQWKIIEKIALGDAPKVYFGDCDQAIFSFMGSSIEILKEHTKNFKKHFLTINFRSPQYLLDLHNEYKRKNLKSEFNYLPKSYKNEINENNLLIKELKDNYEEIEWIVTYALKNKFKTNTAILVRTNKQADEFAKELDKYNLKYLKISGFDLFSRKEIKDLLAFFNILINKYNRNAWTRVFNNYVNSIKTLKGARDIINKFFKIGINPLDLVVYNKSLVEEFYEVFNSKRVVVFDTETTGTDINNDDIIQIAAVEIINGKIGKTFEVYIKTDKSLEETVSIHKITSDFLEKNGLERKKALKKFKEFINEDILIAHNADFDINILNANLNIEKLPTIDNLYFDSIEITKRLFPKLPSYKLEYLLDAFKIEGVNSHNALDDVKATANLLLFLNNFIKKENILNKQLNFKEKNKNTIYKFTKNLTPIYQAISSRFTDNMGLNEVLDLVMSYMQTNLNYKINENIFNEIEKLTKHIEYYCDKNIPLYESLKKYIPEYSKYKEVDLVTGKEDIVISTIHKAKGLEWENVIIPHCVEGIYPNFKSKSEKEILEDARLLYVALSRAKKRILITYSRKYKGYPKRISIFLENVKKFFIKI